MSMIETSFAQEASNFFSTMQANKSISLGEGLAARIREDMAKTSTSYTYLDSTPKIFLIMGIYFKRNAESIYRSGMISLLHIILSIYQSECDTFIIFSHLIENIYPKVIKTQDFFTEKQNSSSFFSELRCFSVLVEKMRPKVVKSLIYKSNDKNLEKFAFDGVIRKLAETWYSNLFLMNFDLNDLIRIWDCMFVFGFDFIRKFALALLSDLESVFLMGVNRELSGFNTCKILDSLVLAGNSVRKKVTIIRDGHDVERIIKKVMTKESYVGISIQTYLEDCRVLEESSEMRIVKLRNTQNLMELMKYTVDDMIKFFEYLDQYESDILISRITFCALSNKMISLDVQTATTFFITFDQQGTDQLSVLSLKLALALIKKGLNTKLKLIVACLDEANNPYINPIKLEKIVQKLEELFDYRNSSYKLASKNAWNSFKKCRAEDLPKILTNHSFFKGLKSLLEYLDLQENGKYRTLRQFSVNDQMIETNNQEVVETEEVEEQHERSETMRTEVLENINYNKFNFSKPKRKSRFHGFIDKYVNTFDKIPEEGSQSGFLANQDDQPSFLPNLLSNFSSVSNTHCIYDEQITSSGNIESKNTETRLDFPKPSESVVSSFSTFKDSTRKSCSRICSASSCILS